MNWHYKFVRDIVADLVTVVSSSKASAYSAVLEMDERLRAFTPHALAFSENKSWDSRRQQHPVMTLFAVEEGTQKTTPAMRC